MNPKLILCLALVLSGGWLPLAHANLGETFSQINARYGQPVTGLNAPSHDKSEFIHVYQFNDRRIYVTIMDGKSCCEAVRTPSGQMTEVMALAIAAKISGETNWTEQKRNSDGVQWLGDTIWVMMEHHPDADIVFVQSVQYYKDEIDRENKKWISVHMPSTNQTNNQSDMAARVLKSHQELADQGDRYGEYRMGLRYRDGDGVPKDLDKAREWLQKSADQGDTDAATELAKLSPKPELKLISSKTSAANTLDLTNLTILSAEFGMGKQVTNVTARVIELLHTQPGGFIANAKSLGADPLPGKKKRLVVSYDYKGEAHTLTIPAAKEMSYQSLVKNVSK